MPADHTLHAIARQPESTRAGCQPTNGRPAAPNGTKRIKAMQIHAEVADVKTLKTSLHSRRGVTLIELMVVVAIIAIIGAVALPSYLSSIRKGRRADASDAAAGVLQAQERWRSNDTSYTTSLASLNQLTTTANGYYTQAISAASATGYTLTFTPVASKGQNNDTGCTSLVVTVTNGNPVYTPATCWSR
jgi:type IV pilus assembly protein PilE